MCIRFSDWELQFSSVIMHIDFLILGQLISNALLSINGLDIVHIFVLLFCPFQVLPPENGKVFVLHVTCEVESIC